MRVEATNFFCCAASSLPSSPLRSIMTAAPIAALPKVMANPPASMASGRAGESEFQIRVARPAVSVRIRSARSVHPATTPIAQFTARNLSKRGSARHWRRMGSNKIVCASRRDV